MSRQPDNPPAVRKVTLPSGKTIEIVYFTDAPPTAPARDLHACCNCDSKLVYPTAWAEAQDGAWSLALRCPNCEWTDEGTFERPVVEALDEQLDRATHALVRDLKDLAQANMEDEVERFSAALAADQIWPIDF